MTTKPFAAVLLLAAANVACAAAGAEEPHAIHQEVSFNCSAAALYKALTDSNEFSAFTGYPATIVADAGGTFSAFGGQINGMTIELNPSRSIVQAWRVATWPEATYSIVRFALQAAGEVTTLTLDHGGFPPGTVGHLDTGWHEMYWEPLKASCEK